MNPRSSDRQRDISALRRYMLGAQIASIGLVLFGLIAIGTFINPTLIGSYAKSDSIWLWVGCGFIGFGILFVVIATSWSLRLLWILQNVRPRAMQLSMQIVRRSDSTDYTAILDNYWRVSLYSPSWKVDRLQEMSIPAQVYFDPKTNRPAVIETQQGLLWAMAGRSAVHL